MKEKLKKLLKMYGVMCFSDITFGLKEKTKDVQKLIDKMLDAGEIEQDGDEYRLAS